ncbi:sodium:solute symporter family protein [Geomicrobium sediminis]|uniref:SSS family transporter n=1 Tax=Geomicrobium sediminis TaxID=1347788 RepID=A0ABS2PBB3_9BACL|nr:sodium:solute symporter family protein [Geomicrobium sediminis]MBM7632286.1 SSS family transporter [Geomicrobium sediminis]
MNVTMLIIVLYLLAMIMIGFIYKKKASQDEVNFLVAGRSMGITIGGGALASTYASTSSFLGTLGAMHVFGIGFGLWQNIGVIIGFAVAAVFIAPRFRSFSSLSFSQFFEQRFDKRVRGFAAFVTVITMFVYMLAQIQGGALAMQFVLGVEYWIGVIVLGVVFITYVIMGGSHSSVIASFIQFCMMMVAMITVAVVVFIAQPWAETATTVVANHGTSAFHIFGTEGPLYALSSGFMMTLGIMSAPHVYMMFMFTKTEKVARKTTALATSYLSVFYFSLLIVGSYIIATYPNLENSDMGYFYVLDMLPAVLIGLFIAAVLAAAMSSTDAQLLSATSAITNDLYRIFTGKTISQNRIVFVNRCVALVIGILAILVTLNPPDLIMFVMALAQSLMIGAFFVPLVLGLFWKRATADAAFLGMISGFIVTVSLQFIPMPTPFLGGPIGAIVSLIVIVSVSLRSHQSFERNISQ